MVPGDRGSARGADRLGANAGPESQPVAEHAKRSQGLDVYWQSEVLVTSGATEALGDCLFGLS